MTMTRRLLAGAAAATAIALMAVSPAAAQKVKIGIIYPSPIGDVGWAKELDVGREAIAKELGDKVEFAKAENIPEGPDAARIMNQMAGENPKLIVLGSFGYMNDGLKLAARRSDIDFIHASGYKTAPNFAWFLSRNYESATWRA
jgi:basic membrane protein A and related proteins